MRGREQQHQRVDTAWQRHKRRIEHGEYEQTECSEGNEVFGNSRQAFGYRVNE
jgi:hypothetical protein